MAILKNLWKFSKRPIYRSYREAPIAYKTKIFWGLLGWNLFLGIALVSVGALMTNILGLELGKHASEDLFSQYPMGLVILVISVIAPVLEELLFRGPLVLFRDHVHFRYFFYASALLFGLVHIFNFEASPHLLYMAPILVAPQLVMGFFLGYIRIKLGLRWSILLHAAHNTVLLVPLVALKLLNLPLE